MSDVEERRCGMPDAHMPDGTAIEWKTCPNFPKYEVSSLGYIRNAKTKRLLKPWKPKNGYLQVKLMLTNTIWFNRSVHVLVAKVFHGPRPKGWDVHHINGNLDDCRECNVEYMHKTLNRGKHDDVVRRDYAANHFMKIELLKV